MDALVDTFLDFGDIGKDSATMIDYFEKNGGAPCPPGKNPAEMVRWSLPHYRVTAWAKHLSRCLNGLVGQVFRKE